MELTYVLRWVSYTRIQAANATHGTHRKPSREHWQIKETANHALQVTYKLMWKVHNAAMKATGRTMAGY
jgi:hypothetical protein